MARCTKFGSVDVRFSSEEKARQYSASTLKSAEVKLRSTYFESLTYKVEVVKVPLEIDLAWLVAGLVMDMKHEFTILQATKYLAQKWIGQSLKIIIQATPQDHEEFPNLILIREEVKLKVLIEDKKD